MHKPNCPFSSKYQSKHICSTLQKNITIKQFCGDETMVLLPALRYHENEFQVNIDNFLVNIHSFLWIIQPGKTTILAQKDEETPWLRSP